MHPPLPLFQQASHWFRRAQASLLEALPCSQGCCDCCIGIFPITQLDVLELHRGLDLLPFDRKAAIVTRAREQVASLELAFPDLRSTPNLDEWTDSSIDAIVERFADLPCPALAADGRCSVYAFRPITCRTMGVPVESDGVVQGACRVQTAVPIIRPSPSLRTDYDLLAKDEAVALSILRQAQPEAGDELLLPYGFI
ncbi:MAG: YkgJ family cysteine cluster protein [Nitrospira sp.]|nr:YkgJ family cysteine cluster protein [Nitrospira sp.]